MKASRKIIGSDIGFRDYTKSASGFINDFTGNDYVRPQFVRITDHDAWQFYKSNEWINATINRIVEACTKLKPKITLKDKSKKARPRHEHAIEMIQSFFDRPNGNKETMKELRTKFLRDLLVYGRGSMEKVHVGRVLNELYTIKADTLFMIADANGTLPDHKAYKQTLRNGSASRGSESIFFDKNEVILKVLRPSSETIYGEKPMDSLANTVASDILRATYNSNFFINGGEASGILSLEGMPKSELQKFKQNWKDNHVGVSKSHRLIAVNTKLNYARMAITNRDMEFTSYGKELRNKIFAVFGMQPVIMGLSDDTTSKVDPDQQNQNWKDYCLKPLLMLEAEAYQNEVLYDGFGLDEYEITFPGIDMVDMDAQSLMDERDIKNGVLTINEVRISRGKPVVPWGDTPMSILPGGNQVDPVTGQIIPPSQQENNTNKPTNSAKKPAKKPTGKKGIDCEDGHNVRFLEEQILRSFSICDTIRNMTADKVVELSALGDFKLHPKEESVIEGNIGQLVERYKADETIDYRKLSTDISNIVESTLGEQG